jgi:ABC-type uncharacterized transport system substrate-binding protein
MRAIIVLGSLLVSLAVGAPRAASAQPTTMPVVGFLGLATPEAYADRVAGILQGLKESGYVEGQNVVIEYRWAHGRVEQLPALAADLARRRVAVIIYPRHGGHARAQLVSREGRFDHGQGQRGRPAPS